ncbi:unnamed protein product, partial [marine sediment metagenome]
GVIADGNAFFGTWSSGSITGMGLNVATGNVTFSGTVTATQFIGSGAITGTTASFVSTVAGATVVSSEGA